MHFPMRSNLDSDKDCCNCCEMIEEHLKYAEKVYNQKPNRKRNRLPRYCILPTFIFKSNRGFIDSHCHLDFLFNRTKFVGTYAEYQIKHKATFPQSYRGCIAVFCKPSTFSKQWALSAAGQFKDFEFKASERWVKKFKKEHKIRQRKITKYLSQKETATLEEILKSAETFRIQTLHLMPKFDKDFVINTDQTGCQYQSTFNRTLADKGSKTIFVKRQDINKLTHTYTAQYALTLSGKLLPKVFVCLQEPTGKFGPRVQKIVEEYSQKYKNIIITSSKSGKLSTELYIDFLQNCLKPYVEKENFLLLVDSWRGQTKPEIYDEVFQDDYKLPTCTLKIIPPKCTPIVQPCDVYFYRQVKNFIKHLQNSAFLIEQNREINSREDCIKIQSIVHHQLSSPIFEKMIRYANKCSKEIQHKVFRRQLKIAYDTGLRVVIHCRDANKDCINIMREFLPKDYIFHLHCFTDSWHWAQKWLKTFPNVFIGITNLVTYKSAKLTHEVAKKIPLNHLLLETDAPYFVPRKVSKRIRWSHPGMAIHVAAQIAALRNITVEEVLYWTHKNTIIMYEL
ncbi:putative deoxyribonuclease TATDN2 [Trichonephila inaurata madagascariensis]|uniref:Putative deoxyribonuclease TATDN2 n=1 Tax=Trichonephila inaurata madagascariensis TaxID=2747483 RepID=A0A8X7C3S4_9ARAC|nr:putative deoxyribonuclease TATDN2 [Trichonephila inaurata madagascariensis]